MAHIFFIKKTVQDSLLKLSVIGGAIFLWYAITVFLYPTSSIIPTPNEVFLALYNLMASGAVFVHIFESLKRVIVGFLIATFFGVGLALVVGYYKRVGTLLSPLVEFLRPIPPIAWIPIAILVFGLGDTSAYFIVFVGAFFPIFTSSFVGVDSLPVIYRNVAHSFELRRLTFVKDILFKFSLPYIFTGLKIGIGMAWMSVIAAELIGAQSGLGYFIQLNRLLLRTDNVVAGMVLIGVIGFFLNWFLSVAEKRIVPWSDAT